MVNEALTIIFGQRGIVIFALNFGQKSSGICNRCIVFDCVLNFVLVMNLRAIPANIELQNEFEKRFGPLDMAIGSFMATKRFSPLDLAISDFVEQ